MTIALAGMQMDYKGHQLEQKELMVGWQITIMKHDRVIRHSGVMRDLNAALLDAHAYIDSLPTPE
jgi:hypothetical protein